MMFKLAARNLGRNKRRSLITVAAIAFGLALMIVTINLAHGSYESMIRNAIEAGAGHVVVQAKGYQDDPEPSDYITDSQRVVTALTELFPGARASERIFLEALLTSPENAQGGMVIGVNPTQEAAVRDLTERVTEGTWLAPDDHKGIVLGEALAQALGVEIGDKVVVMAQVHADVDSALFRVRGLWHDQVRDVERGFAVIHLEAARGFLQADQAANQVALLIEDPSLSEQSALEAAAALQRADVEVLSWRQALPDLDKMIALDKMATDIYLFIVASIVMLGVLNTVLMSVMERTREFGVILALGVRPRRLTAQVLTEGLLLGVFAVILGVALGALFTIPLQVYGIPIEELAGEAFESSDMPMDSTLRASFDGLRIAKYAVATVILTIISSAWPALRAGRLSPVDAMRHV